MKSSLSDNILILKEIQFMDELPAINLWKNYISQSEVAIHLFKNDLVVTEFFHFENLNEARSKLEYFLGNDKFCLLFCTQSNAILFHKDNIFPILDCLDFFNDEFLLYGMDSQSIITGGGSIESGFITWSRTID